MKTSVSSRRRSKRRSRNRSLALFAIAILVIVAIVEVLWPRRRIENVIQRPVVQSAPVLRDIPWTRSQRVRVVDALTQTFAPAVDSTDAYSLVVLDAQGRTLFARSPSRTVIPASVQKLIVASSALQLLAPYYRFHTLLASPGGIDRDGALHDPLWLIGSGDPSFRSTDLDLGVASLQSQGLRNVQAGVAVDASAQRGPEINPRWNPDDAGEDFQAPTSAISIDGDTAEFRVYGQAAGVPARVVVLPQTPALSVSGTILSSDGSDDVVIAPMPENNVFVVHGTIPEDTEEKFWLPVHGITHLAGSVLIASLRRHGIDVGNDAIVRPAPLDANTLWDHRSAPLRTLISHMLYLSDNHYAEQLLRAIGGQSEQPDDRGGIDAELTLMRERGIPIGGVRLYDGSGLAEANRISAMMLARILSDAELRGPAYSLFGLLPEGGKDGTLKHYAFTDALGRVRAKTGHLSDAASLAGYLDTRHHGRITFAFLINDSGGDPDAAYVRALDILSRF